MASQDSQPDVTPECAEYDFATIMVTSDCLLVHGALDQADATSPITDHSNLTYARHIFDIKPNSTENFLQHIVRTPAALRTFDYANLFQMYQPPTFSREQRSLLNSAQDYSVTLRSNSTQDETHASRLRLVGSAADLLTAQFRASDQFQGVTSVSEMVKAKAIIQAKAEEFAYHFTKMMSEVPHQTWSEWGSGIFGAIMERLV